jgi:hypothetical protein
LLKTFKHYTFQRKINFYKKYNRKLAMKYPLYTLSSRAYYKKIFYFSVATLFLIPCVKVWGDSTHFPKDLIDQENHSPSNNPIAIKREEFKKLFQSPKNKPTRIIPSKNNEKSLKPVVLKPPTKLPSPSKKDPSPVITVKTRPQVQPLAEKKTSPPLPQEQEKPSSVLNSYSTVAKERPPLAQLDPSQEVQAQKWVLFSSAKRGLKSSRPPLDIVNVVGEKGPTHRGEEVKNLLIEMGVKPEHLRVINVKAEENQPGQVYIFGGK